MILRNLRRDDSLIKRKFHTLKCANERKRIFLTDYVLI